MPYKDPDKQREYVKTHRDHFYKTSIMEELLQYYVVSGPRGIRMDTVTKPDDEILYGPGPFICACAVFVRENGLAQDFGD